MLGSGSVRSLSRSASAPNVQRVRQTVVPARFGSAASGAVTSAPTPSYLRDYLKTLLAKRERIAAATSSASFVATGLSESVGNVWWFAAGVAKSLALQRLFDRHDLQGYCHQVGDLASTGSPSVVVADRQPNNETLPLVAIEEVQQIGVRVGDARLGHRFV